MIGSAIRSALLTLLLSLAGALPAWSQDVEIVDPDSLKISDDYYETSYDRDRTRSLWTQTLAYGSKGETYLFDMNASVTTQDFISSKSKSTLGSIYGTLNLFPRRHLLISATGNYGMSSSRSGRSGLDNRDNRINLRAQYNLIARGLNSWLSAYTEFGQKHDRVRSDATRLGADFDSPDRVDSTTAQRDSSYTSSRTDGLYGDYRWALRPWFTLYGTARGYRIYPTITSYSRTFVQPLDGTPGGYVQEEVERNSSPTGNTDFTQTLTLNRPFAMIDVLAERHRLAQSYFDKPRGRQESSRFETNSARMKVSSFLFRPFSYYMEAAISRRLNLYSLNTNLNQLTRYQKLFTVVTHGDSGTTRSVSVNFLVERSRTELNPNVSGVEVNRSLGANGRLPTGRKLTLDAYAHVGLLSNDFVKDRDDRDIQRTAFSVGGGYLLTPVCSTTVHFSRSSSYTVFLDPELSGSNARTTNYQMTATMQYLPNRNFALRQNYILSAEYRILDYAEFQNSLRRVRRIDTDMSDTLLSSVFVRLSHTFIFQDQGTYARRDGPDRRYRVASQSYDQTLTATAGLKIVPGVVFLATQSLLNNRTNVLVSETRTRQNTWKLNVALEVNRSFSDGMGIRGAVRRVEEYVEDNRTIEPRRDWVAGVSFHRGF